MRVGRYEVEAIRRQEPLGRVLLAVQPELQRRVYIKELCPPPALTPAQRALVEAAFEEECSLVCMVRDPRVPRPVDAGASEAGRFLAFDAPEEAGYYALPAHGAAALPGEWLQAAAGLAEALASLSEAGVVPSVFDPEGAFCSAAGDVRYLHLHLVQLAAAAGLSGTFTMVEPHWAAPETILGQPATAAALSFSVAAWLHAMLHAACAGTPAQVRSGGAACWQPNPDIPPAADDALRQALSADPAQRPSLPCVAAALREPAPLRPVRRPVAATEPTIAWTAPPAAPNATLYYLAWAAGLAAAGTGTGWLAAQLFAPR